MLAILILVLSVPATVFLVQKEQEIRQRASGGVAKAPPTISPVRYPWQYSRTANSPLPEVSTTVRSFISKIPFTSHNCSRKSLGDADCNNQLDMTDVSFWQIDFQRGTAKYADFNKDKKVTLADFNVWRKNSHIQPKPVLQKLSERFGIVHILAATVEKIVPPISFTVMAADANLTLADSSVQSSGGTSYILNQYADQSYSLQTNQSSNDGGQITYYDSNGNTTARVNSYSRDASTTTTQVNGNNVSITQSSDGAVHQLIQTADGSFRAAQVWPSNTAYTRGDFPQAVTLPIGSGYTTVTLTPNNGAQIISRDRNGNTTSYAAISNSNVSINDYVNKTYTVSNADSNKTWYTIQNNLGGQTAYLFVNGVVVAIRVTDSKGNTTYIIVLSDSQYRLIAVDTKGNVTSDQQSTDPMGILGVNSPSPAAMTQTTQQYARTRNSSTTSFTTAFAANGRMPRQLIAVNRLLAIQNSHPLVLGAKTAKDKSVLGVSIDKANPSLLAAAGSSAQPSSGGSQSPGGAFMEGGNQIVQQGVNIIGSGLNAVGDATPGVIQGLENQFNPNGAHSLPGAPANAAGPLDYNYVNPAGRGPDQDMESPNAMGPANSTGGRGFGGGGVDNDPANSAPAAGGATTRGGSGFGGGGVNGGTGDEEPNSGMVNIPVNPAGRGPDQDMEEPNAMAPAPHAGGPSTECSSCSPAPVNPNFSTGPAAANVAAETSVSVSVSTNVTNADGSTFSSNGSTSTATNASGSISVTADHGVATSISIDGNVFSNTGTGWELSSSVPGNPPNGNTWAALDGALQQQAQVTGVDQVSAYGGTVSADGSVSTDGSVSVDASAGSVPADASSSNSGGYDANQGLGDAYGANQYAADHPDDAQAQQNAIDATNSYNDNCGCGGIQQGDTGPGGSNDLSGSSDTGSPSDSAPGGSNGPEDTMGSGGSDTSGPSVSDAPSSDTGSNDSNNSVDSNQNADGSFS